MFDRLPRNLAIVLETKFRLILFDLSELVSYQILKHLIFLFLLLIQSFRMDLFPVDAYISLICLGFNPAPEVFWSKGARMPPIIRLLVFFIIFC